MRTSVIVLLGFCYFVKFAHCDCTINLNELPKLQPIYIKDGDYWMPNKDTGKLVVKDSETLIIGCPGKTNEILIGKDAAPENTMEAQCVKGKTFSVGKWQGPFASIKCKSSPTITSKKTSTSCYGGNRIYRVGFTLASSSFKLYEICFDVYGATTVYTNHILDPAATSNRQSSGRPAFMENGMFETTAVAELYKSKNQKTRLDKILGAGMGDKYIQNNQFLAKGHLSPRADFPLYSQQRATFLYANVAPQWTRSNGGDWASLEESIRDRVKRYGKEITIYTGTFGVEQLNNSEQKLTDIYLDVDRNNNDILPVPLYYYKVIYDPLHKKAAAFVQINSSFFNNHVTRNLTFCDDICQSDPKMAWVKWRENDGTTSFCCSYEEFRNTVKHFDLDVKGLFYK